MVTPENTAAPVTRTALRITGPVPADSRQYVWSSHTAEYIDQPGKVANPARGQLNRENKYSPILVRAREFGLARRIQPSRPASACSFSMLRLAVNAIGTQLCDPINSGMARWRMAVSYGGNAVTEIERKPVSKHQPIRFSLSVENERADAGRDGQACLARPTFQARTGTGKYSFFPCPAHHAQDWQPYPAEADYRRTDHNLTTCMYQSKQRLL